MTCLSLKMSLRSVGCPPIFYLAPCNYNIYIVAFTQLQYADDTILFMDYDDKTIRNVKFLLYCFEWMSGLKINFHKQEVYNMGLEDWSTRGLQICLIVILVPYL